MNATMVTSGTKAVPSVVSSIQDIPLVKIRESKTNPRRFFDEAKLAELADNIKQHGVLQPILLRPLPQALDYFRRLGHDNHRRLSKLHSWGEKKSKTSWGAQTVDYEKIAAAAVQAMKTADLNRFLVVCALVSDLYCPGYNPRQSLEKNSNLARTAGRNKIDSAKISEAVRAELSKAKSKVTKQSQPANKLSTAKSPRHEQPK